MTREVDFLIIGAGPTGLGAAHRLKALGQNNFLLLESTEKAGGLASSFQDENGFTWDIGGHVQFSHYPYFDTVMDNLFDEGGWLTHRRSAWAWMMGRFVPYPVQSNLEQLPPDVAQACLNGLSHRPSIQPGNFADWLLNNFGQPLADIFMTPYNRKVWAHNPEEMGYQWVQARIAPPTQGDTAWGRNNFFRFPATGGTGHIWQTLAGQVGARHFRFNTPVRRIDAQKREVLADGGSYRYRRLINTAPLNMLCALMGNNLPQALHDAAGQLVHSATHVIGIGLEGVCPPQLQAKSWIYFPENNCPFYRATVFSNYSPAHTPDPARYWSLMAETSESPSKPVNSETLAEETLAGCIATGLVPSRGAVRSVWQYRAPYGYPVPTLGRDSALAALVPALEAQDIYSRGRFGGWKYEVSNQDHSFMQGVELVNRLLQGEPETTYRLDPHPPL